MPRGGRPRVKGFEASPSQHKRASVSVLRKIVINSYVERNGIAAAVDRFYPSLHSTDRKLKKRQLHEWYEDRADIADQVARGNGHLNKMPRNGIGCVLPRDAEDRLAFWVRDLRREGVPVSPLMLQIKARTLATTIGLNRSQFAASCSWRRRFLKTYRLSLRRRTRIGQRTPDDARQVAEAFSKKVNDLMLKHGITEVCNANQTALNFEHLSTQTIDETGTRTVWVRNCGKEKARFTAMLLADSRGFQRAPFLVFKQPASRVKATESYKRAEQNGFGRDLWKKVRNMQASTGMTIYCNSRGWWNAELSVEFLKSHFAKRANPDVPILLIWDEFSGHWTAEVESCAKDLNVLLVKVPGGYTSVCQPADIAGMRPLKLKLRDQWLGDIERQFQQYQGKQEKFVLQPPIRETVVGWLHASWSRLSRATIVGGFRKIGVASDLREPPEEEPAAFENKLQEVLKTLESCSAAFDVSKEAE